MKKYFLGAGADYFFLKQFNYTYTASKPYESHTTMPAKSCRPRTHTIKQDLPNLHNFLIILL